MSKEGELTSNELDAVIGGRQLPGATTPGKIVLKRGKTAVWNLMRLSQCNRKPHNARVEKIMSTTNDTSGELTRNELDAVLQDDELDAASGGLYVNPITGILFGVVLPAVKSLLEP